MISIEEIEFVHSILIETFGGTKGIRDLQALQSAITRPFQTFAQEDLYPTLMEKAASLIESLVSNHPFVDGNKRTGYTMLRLFLLNYGIDLKANEADRYEFVMTIANGKAGYEEILEWLKQHTIQK